MALYDDPGVTSESPTGTEVQQADPSSAGTLNTEQQPGQVPDRSGNWIPRERANEMAQRAADRAVAQASQAFAAERQQMQDFFARQSQQSQQTILQGLQERANRPSLSPEDERQRQLAQTAFNGLLVDHPEWKNIVQASQATPELAREWKAIRSELAQLKEENTRAHTLSEEGRLQQLAHQAGIPVATPQQFARVNRDVANVLRADPEALKAFFAKDRSVLPWALEQVKAEYAERQQMARAAASQAKSQLGKLPPRIGGGQPGAPPPPRYDPKDPRGSMNKIHDAAANYLEQHAG